METLNDTASREATNIAQANPETETCATDHESAEIVHLFEPAEGPTEGDLYNHIGMLENDNAMLRAQVTHLQRIIDLMMKTGKGYVMVAQDADRRVVNVADHTIRETFRVGTTVAVRIEPTDAHPMVVEALMNELSERRRDWFPDAGRVIVIPPGVEFLTLVPVKDVQKAMEQAINGQTEDIRS